MKVSATLTVLLAVAGTITESVAHADQLANERAVASAIATKISALGQEEDALSEQYDLGVQKLASAKVRLDAATRAFQIAEQERAKTIALLQQDAVQAYVGGGPESALGAPASLTNLDQALLRQELERTFAADQTSALDGYQLAEANASTAQAKLAAARNADAHQLSLLGSDRQRVQASQAKLVSLEQHVQGRIATLVAQIQHEQLLAEQRAAAARLARLARLRAEEAAAAAAAAAKAREEAALEAAATTTTAPTTTVAPAATTTTTPAGTLAPAAATTTVPPPATTTPPPTTPPPAPNVAPGASSAAATAVQAALSRVGDPYVWGAAGPGAFDCSGLVMWSYAQAGIYLPHYSGAQYADTTHIPMSALQPGDLVFPANPGQHVAMYIGNGEIVQAPYTGADVQVVPLSSFFVLASQVG